MSKYISEDILLEDLWDSKCESDILRRVRQAIVDEIIGIEGIDIVRCGECKHWRTYETWSECELWTDDPYESAKTKADDFCSYGERREP